MQTKFQGSAVPLKGTFPQVGETAKDFTLTGGDLSEWTLSAQKGKFVLNIFPSVDTPVCALATERFSKEAEQLSGVTILCISKDLPFAQGRFCEEKGIKNVTTLSAFRNSTFGADYGVEIAEGPLSGLLARAVVVIEDGVVRYTQLVGEITDQPDYEAVLATLR